MANIYTVKDPCEFCGKPHYEYCIDGHICVPHICDDCWRKCVGEWAQTSKCIECERCSYIHEYESYWCNEYKMPIDKDWHTGGCRYFNEYSEVDK